MKILLWHGYLLTGSGSNLYTANIARTWRTKGHDVLVLCQERSIDELDFIDESGDFDATNASFATSATGVPSGRGRCSVVRPFIGEVLPVYVYDVYEGFTAKRFVDLSDGELDDYTARNVAALVTAIERFEPDVIITGHEVMGPFIALEACRATHTSYLAKLHGSALEYAVKEDARYVPYATEGLGGATVVAGGSRYMIEAASAVIPGWLERSAVVNPGCDIELFHPVERTELGSALVGYVGKFIVAKGVHNLLAALGLTSAGDMRVTGVGYGGFEAELHALWRALSSGDVTAARDLATEGEGRPLPALVQLLDAGGVDDRYIARATGIAVDFPGRLEHGPLSRLLPTFDLLVVPSVVPEAFGMVAAEAAASAVLPIVPDHSGIGEVGAALEAELGHDGLLTFDAGNPVEGIAEAIDRLLTIPFHERRELALGASRFARAMWSWDHFADRLLELAVGGPDV